MAEPIKVLGKAVAVLEQLAEHQMLSASELAVRLQEPRPTVYRLLESLEMHRLVERSKRRGHFELGPKLLTLAATVMHGYDDILAVARPVMRTLNEQTGQTVFLCVRRGLEAICVERIDGQLVQLMVLPVGGSIALHGGAVARALLAFEPRSLWMEFLGSGQLERFTDATPQSREELIEELEHALAAGYVISDGDVIPGIASIGAPILSRSGAVRASLSVSGPRPSVLDGHQTEMTRLVLEASEEIAASLR